MAKRKRIEDHEQVAQNNTPHKKRRKSLDRRNPKSQQSSAAQRSKSSLPSPTKPAQTGSKEIDSIPEPPPGLTKAQRKRWRRRQKRNRPDTTTINRIVSDQEPASRIAPKATNQTSFATRNDRSTLRRYAVTKLLPRPEKRWYDDDGRRDANEPELDSEPGLEEHLSESSFEEDLPESAKEEERDSEDSRSDVSLQNAPSVLSSGNESEESLPPPRTPTAAQQVDTRRGHDVESVESTTAQTSHPLRYTPALQHQQPSHSYGINDGILSSVSAPEHATHVLTRSTFINKATSVPQLSSVADTAASFKRFGAFLRGGDSETSDDDSSESDDDEIGPRQAMRGKPAADGNDDAEFQAIKKQQLENQYLVTDSEVAIESEIESLESHVENKEPTISSAPPKPTQTGVSSWPANVGIKRRMPSPEQEPPAPLSSSAPFPETVKPGPAERHRASQRGHAFEISEDELDMVFQSIDEVSNNIFGSTRPLPASKPTVSERTNVESEDGLITLASSDRRVTRSKSTPKTKEKHAAGVDFLPAHGETAVICNTVHVTDVPDVPLEEKKRWSSNSVDRTLELLGESIQGSTTAPLRRESSSSELSELSRSPSPPSEISPASLEPRPGSEDEEFPTHEDTEASVVPEATSAVAKKRKMTGRTSKHFIPEKRVTRKTSATVKRELSNGPESESKDNPNMQGSGKNSFETPVEHVVTRSKRKSTGNKSTFFTPSKPKPVLDTTLLDRVDLPTSTGKKRISGISIAPVPPISSARFGIIQEKLWLQPFWLLIAVTFLNQTPGRAAVPVFWKLKDKYSTPEGLANADEEELTGMIWKLGFQRQRARRVIAMAKGWMEQPPTKGTRWRTLHYPLKGDGKGYKRNIAVEDDADDCEGALEIAHIPGCGPYAWDSWRIFCRDVLRGSADDFNGKNAREDFDPEWKKVLPLDKELRACLRWMWLREGWIWDGETGDKWMASEEEMERAKKGEMAMEDAKEREFVAVARNQEEDSAGVERVARTPEPSKGGKEDDMSENITVSPARSRGSGVRRSTRLSA